MIEKVSDDDLFVVDTTGGKRMPLSEWPEEWLDNDEEYVEVVFDEPMKVCVETEKAIGLSEDGRNVDFWLPRSKIEDEPPERGDWIDSVSIPSWLADEKGLDY